MCASLHRLKLQGWLYSLPASREFKAIRQGLERSINFLLIIEPLWVLTATVLVFLSYLLGWGTFLPWIWLAVAFLPFPLRRIRQGRLGLSTPFDLPIALFMGGALFGLIVSPKIDLSLGAFQCMLAASLFYYSWVNHPHLATLMKWLIVVGLLSALAYAIYYSAFEPPRPPGCLPGTHHGLALFLTIIACVCAGVAIFSKGTKVRVAAGFVCLSLFITAIFIVEESVPRLFAWETVSGRMPRWETTVELLGDSSPFTGLGLGCWGLVYHGTEVLTHPTNVHNSYLELYANTGILGALALVVLLVIGCKLAWDIIRSPRNHPWYGFGIGVLLACVATLLVGVVENSPMGLPLVGTDDYRYIVSPVPWVLGGLLVSAHRLIRETDECYDRER